MYYLLLTLLILDALLLVTVVLLQAGKGGGLAAMGAAGTGSDSLFGSRQATTLLTKATWWTGGIFLALALILSNFSTHEEAPRSILRGGLGAPATAPAPTGEVTIPGVTTPAAEPAAPAAAPEAPAGETAAPPQD